MICLVINKKLYSGPVGHFFLQSPSSCFMEIVSCFGVRREFSLFPDHSCHNLKKKFKRGIKTLTLRSQNSTPFGCKWHFGIVGPTAWTLDLETLDSA